MDITLKDTELAIVFDEEKKDVKTYIPSDEHLDEDEVVSEFRVYAITFMILFNNLDTDLLNLLEKKFVELMEEMENSDEGERK